MKRKNVIISAVLTIALCLSLLAGATFAYFTADSKVNIAVTSGKLDVVATVENVKLYSHENIDMNTQVGTKKELEGSTFLTGGTAVYENGTFTLDKVAPGDGVTFDIKVTNNSDIAAKYRVVVSDAMEGSDLGDQLECEMDDDVWKWKDLPTTEKEFTVSGVSVGLATWADNKWQGRTISFAVIVEVVQGNVAVTDTYPVKAATEITVDEDNKTTAETKIISAGKIGTLHVAKATVPAGAKVEADTTELELSVNKAAVPANFTVKITQNEPKALNIHMAGLAADNDQLVKVEFLIETGLSLVEIDHNGIKMERCSAMKWLDADQEFFYDATTGLVTMLTKNFSTFTYTSDKFYWDNEKAEEYATPVDTSNKVITVATAEELALFKYEVTDEKVNYSGYTLNITADIDLGLGFWRPINPVKNLTINGNGHTIKNLLVRSCTNSSGYGFGFIGNSTGKLTIKNLIFDGASVAMAKGYETYFVGNVGGIVVAYAYGTTLFENVTVTNSNIYGYGKIGCILGMGADPGVSVTFKNCVSKDNTIYGAYDLGGLAGNIQRGNGVDNGKVENCTVENITVNYDPKEDYVDLENVKATFKSNDKPSGTDVTKTISGKYCDNSGYYWCAYGDYYVSYGDSSYDATVEGYDKCLANSEYSVNK